MEKLINYLQTLWTNAIVPTVKKSWDKSKENTDRIIKSINDKENVEDVSVNNLDELSNPVVEAQDKTTQAIKEIPELNLKPLEEKFDEFKTTLEEKDLVVNVETDLKPVATSIESIKKELLRIIKAIPSKVSTKAIESSLGSILKELEGKEPADLSKVEGLLKELKTSMDSLNLEVNIPEFPDFEKALKKYVEKGRIKVEVDRAGGSAQGLTSTQEGKLDLLATEAKQDDIITELQGLDINTDEIETKLDTIISQSPPVHDQKVITYVASGNGLGEPETITYKLDGDTIRTETLTYDSSDRVIDITIT